MIDLNHTYVDLLKADVEGMEWPLTKQENWHNIPVGQVMLEMHFWAARNMTMPRLLRNHIIPMEQAGYFMHTIEPVSYHGEAYEVAWLNVNWNPFHDFHPHAQRIFHPRMYPDTRGVLPAMMTRLP